LGSSCPFSAPFSIARLPVSPFSKLPVRHFGPFGIRFIHYLLRDAALGPDVVPHVLRHTAITWTAQRGILKHEICGFFGITEDV